MEPASDTPPEATATLPAVRVVMPTRDPGPWFEETIQSLADQDYPSLAVTVIYDADDADTIGRRTAALEAVEFVEVPNGTGFGSKVNQVANDASEALLLVCHDDIAIDVAVVSHLVREFVRRGEAEVVIGPKLVDWNDPTRLVPAAFDADRFGETSPHVRGGDLDQGQQDRVGEVFGTSTACLLIDRNFFLRLGGFDPAIEFHGEAHDLALRVRSAGGRVFVSSALGVRHRDGFLQRDGAAAEPKLRRHQMRAALVAASGLHLVVLVLAFVALHVFEFVIALVRLDLSEVRSIPGAWFWNLRNLGSLRARRSIASEVRADDAGETLALRRRGSVRLSNSVDRRVSQREQASESGESITSIARAVGAAILGLLLFFGARHLLTRSIPVVGEFRLLPEEFGTLTADWWSGWREWGMGSEGFAPFALPLLDLLSLPLLGNESLLRILMVVVPIPLGAVGAWRLFNRTDSARAPIAAAALYAASPLPYNALSGGSAQALFLFAALPWIVGHLTDISNTEVFHRSERRTVSGVALIALLALVGAFIPWVAVTFATLVVGIVIGSFLSGDMRGIGQMVMVSALVLLAAAALNSPYLFGLTDWASFGSAGWSTTRGFRLEQLLTLRTGPFGSRALGWAVFAPALFPLVIGRGQRFTWAMRAWGIMLVAWGMTWAAVNGWLPVTTPVAEVMLAPVSLSFAMLAGLAALVIDREVLESTARRAIPAVIATLGFGLALLPLLEGSFSGRWGVARTDLETTLTAVEAPPEEGAYRVVWLADPHVLGSAGHPTGNGLAWTSSINGPPDIRALWGDGGSQATDVLTDAISAGVDGRTSRLGRELSRFGVRYIVVLDQQAPVPEVSRRTAVAATLGAGLSSQLDLTRTGVVNPAVVVYENRAWSAINAAVEPGALTTLRLENSIAALSTRDSVDQWTGQVRAQRDFYAAWQPSQRWSLQVGDTAAPRVDVGPVGMGFQTANMAEGAEASLQYATSDLHRLILGAQVAAWIALAFFRRWIVGHDRRELRANEARLERAT